MVCEVPQLELTILHLAALYGRKRAVQILQPTGDEQEEINLLYLHSSYFSDPLHLAAVNGHLQIVQAIMEWPGVSLVDSPDAHGWTTSAFIAKHYQSGVEAAQWSEIQHKLQLISAAASDKTPKPHLQSHGAETQPTSIRKLNGNARPVKGFERTRPRAVASSNGHPSADYNQMLRDFTTSAATNPKSLFQSSSTDSLPVSSERQSTTTSTRAVPLLPPSGWCNLHRAKAPTIRVEGMDLEIVYEGLTKTGTTSPPLHQSLSNTVVLLRSELQYQSSARSNEVFHWKIDVVAQD